MYRLLGNSIWTGQSPLPLDYGKWTEKATDIFKLLGPLQLKLVFQRKEMIA